MKGSRIIIVLGVILVLAGITIYYLMQGKKAQLAAPAPSVTESPTSTTQPEEKKMSTAYDLTAQADGLSKAVATITLEKGAVMKWRFYTNEAPNTVKRITQLISEGFYNGVSFHRVIPGFVAQGGDPTGTGSGGSGVKLKAEFNNLKHVPGILSMARTSDPNSADSQFFIMLGAQPHLDNQYTIFGKVVEGGDVPPTIKQGDKIKSATIE